MRPGCLPFGVILLAAMLSLPAILFAQSGDGGDSLDADLLQDLTEDLDLGPIDLGPQTPEPAPKTEEPMPDGQPQGDESPATAEGQGTVTEGPTVDVTSEPLIALREQMRAVEKRLENRDAGESTRSRQQEIVATLDEMIRIKREKQRSPSPSNDEQKPPDDQQPQDSPEQSGSDMPPGGEGADDPDATESTERQRQRSETQPKEDPANRLSDYLRAEWGHLPEREREQVIQSFNERFLPEYDALIRAYYENLSRSE